MAIVVLEIVSLLWSHPILAGLLILLFTTPLFHIVLFFTPLLMSTALCVIALISIGPQIEKIREERQFKMSMSSRSVVAAPERPANRYIVISQGRPQRPAMRLGGGGGGGRRWSDWVKGIEIHGHTIWLSESHIMRDIAEEGLKSDFSHEDGGIAMAPEDLCSSKGGAFSLEKATAASLCDVDNPGEADRLIEEECQHLELVEVKQADEEPALHSETGIVSLDPVAEGDKEDAALLELASCSVTRAEDNAGCATTEKAFTRNSNACFVELVGPSAAASTQQVLALSETSFALGLPSPPPPIATKKKKRTSWFRRQRIPCGLSKALGQLREKICNQLRRIFT
ncbi:uncharacterized protein LOC112345622 [Selaginella moellendorffii]|uniref:uncharacterized protein LOC112345622 n=1 Tax=Selaginella moellendorffii TaxID=88036 RepID=UPI000D1C2405|nr:uncharacterized protein LOC112345622 [Selaginella moellendorffii]|eukprot:XP_024528536.1 uncharacterized protein LOC112345622 [Selaginella moellendorffii]